MKPPGIFSAKSVVVEDPFLPTEPLVIRDVGQECRSVTNDAEKVVEDLFSSGRLRPGQRLLYYDSAGRLDEILIRDGRFAGFAPWPRSS